MSLENRRAHGASQLHLICDVETSKDDLFSDSDCSPDLFLVQGHSQCTGLPEVVSAKKLVDITEAGHGEVQVEAAWEELPGKCVLVLRKSSCDSEASGSGEVIDVGEADEETSGDADSRAVEGLAEAEGYLSAGRSTVLRAAQGRTYSSISLSGFTLLSSGSTSQ